MALTLTPADVKPDLSPKASAKYDDPAIEKRIAGAIALAKVYAPCISRETFANSDAAAEIVRGAVVYDLNAAAATDDGTPKQMQSAGAFQVTNFAPTRSGTLFSPSQIAALAALCPAVSSRSAYSVPLGMPESLRWGSRRSEGHTS